MIYLQTVDGRDVKNEKAHTLTYSYIFQNGISLQRLLSGGGTIIKDTIIIDEVDEIHFIQGKIDKPKDAFVYKNFYENLLRIEYSLENETRAIKDTIPINKWELHNESKEILGYVCKMATTTTYKSGILQNIIAWYTIDIPVRDGPLDFSGLPGMILKLDINKSSSIFFENIQSISSIENTIEEPEYSVPTLTLSQYNLIYRIKN